MREKGGILSPLSGMGDWLGFCRFFQDDLLELSSWLCALAVQCEAIQFKSKGRAQIECGRRSLGPAEDLQEPATGQLRFV